jgi:hypothetical protein
MSLKISKRDQIELKSYVLGLAPWKIFATFTFSRPRGEFEAQRRYQSFMDRVCPQVSHFYAIECNPSSPGHHIHALWANCDDVVRRDVWRQWFHQNGRNRIEPIKEDLGAAFYCAKYLVKGNVLWGQRIDIGTAVLRI